MPIRKLKAGGFKWGAHGHVYPTREGAVKQAQAAYAHGYVGKSLVELQKSTALERRRRDDKRAVATGVGMTAAGAGLIGGGIPGVQARSEALSEMKSSKGQKKFKPGLAAGRGGIFGYREHAHRGYMADKAKELKEHKAMGGTTWEGHIGRGQTAGKIAAEKKIIPHLKAGRRASNAALIGGLGLMAYGSQRKPKLIARENTVPETHPVKKTLKATSTNPRRDNQALAAGGATGAVGSYGIARGLERQGNKWTERARGHYREARKISPEAGEFRSEKTKSRVGKIKPVHTSEAIHADPGRFVQGKSIEDMEKLGKLRGQATQARYFSGVYGANAKVFRRAVAPAAALAGATGGVNLYRQKRAAQQKGKVRKSLVMISSEAGYGSVEKGRFRDARYARIAARRARRYAAAQAKGGTFVERNVAKPISTELGRTVNESVDRAGAHFQRMGDEAAEKIKVAAQESSRKAVKRVGLGVGLGVGGGIAGGTTLGAVGARMADPYGRHQDRRSLNQAVKRQQKTGSIRKPPPKTQQKVLMKSETAGYGSKDRISKDLGDYPFLLPNIRHEMQYGIPETRMNPISPLQLVAGANLAAAGYTEVKRKWPIGKKKRRERGMLKLSIANLVSGQPSGLGV